MNLYGMMACKMFFEIQVNDLVYVSVWLWTDRPHGRLRTRKYFWSETGPQYFWTFGSPRSGHQSCSLGTFITQRLGKTLLAVLGEWGHPAIPALDKVLRCQHLRVKGQHCGAHNGGSAGNYEINWFSKPTSLKRGEAQGLGTRGGERRKLRMELLAC